MDFTSKTEQEVRDIAKRYEIDVSKMNRKEMESAIEKESIRRHLKAEAEVRAELAKKADELLGIDPNTKRKPSPETLAIEASKKVYAIFNNREEEGLDITINKGGKYTFHFFDNKVHVVPEWLVKHLREKCLSPRYEMRKNPATGNTESVLASSKPRFLFEVLGDAPKDASFGIVLDDKVLEKLGVTQTVS